MVKEEHMSVNLEESLKYPGYIPLVSSVSGIGRIAYSIYQVASGIFHKAVKKTESEANLANKEVVDGAKNFVRGAVEVVPVVGNAIVAAYDMSRNDDQDTSL